MNVCLPFPTVVKAVLVLQYAVSMLIYLTQGHALCAVQKYDAALKSYEQCLSMALSTHDISYQTKSLVNIATLHVSLGMTFVCVRRCAYVGYSMSFSM